MKKLFYVTTITILSVLLMVSCTSDNVRETGYTENPVGEPADEDSWKTATEAERAVGSTNMFYDPNYKSAASLMLENKIELDLTNEQIKILEDIIARQEDEQVDFSVDYEEAEEELEELLADKDMTTEELQEKIDKLEDVRKRQILQVYVDYERSRRILSEEQQRQYDSMSEKIPDHVRKREEFLHRSYEQRVGDESISPGSTIESPNHVP